MKTITKRAANGMFIDLEQTKGGNWTFTLSTATGVTIYSSFASYDSLYRAFGVARSLVSTKG